METLKVSYTAAFICVYDFKNNILDENILNEIVAKYTLKENLDPILKAAAKIEKL
jgi:hypothetical protein